MSFARARLPFALKCFNKSVAGVRSLGVDALPFRPENLMNKASKATGLGDFGSDYFRRPLDLLCRSLDEDAQLTGLGRIMVRQELERLLCNRLQFIDLFKRHPEIADEQINEPIFILGMPRTGTTSLHELMALDPQFRVPLSWEVARPFPPPQSATYHSDPRIAETDAELARVDTLVPDFRNMHPMGAELPQECVALFSHDFASMIFDVQFRLTQYQAWLIREDMGQVFANHRRWLQLLQWQCPADTWVLKTPQYLWNIEDMLREYPDARMVLTHRDPIKVAVSVASLTATLRSLASDTISLPEVAAHYIDLIDYGNRKTMEARDKGLVDPERLIEVQFADFREDPVAAAASIYQFFSLPLTEGNRRRMQAFIDQGKESERHGRHRYDFAETGLNLERERARFAPYQQRYGVVSETI